jgi:hypothetical protein
MLQIDSRAPSVRNEVIVQARRRVRELAGRGLTRQEIWAAAAFGHELHAAETQLLLKLVGQEFENARWARIVGSSSEMMRV